jgi:hypothetical protein
VDLQSGTAQTRWLDYWILIKYKKMLKYEAVGF